MKYYSPVWVTLDKPVNIGLKAPIMASAFCIGIDSCDNREQQAKDEVAKLFPEAQVAKVESLPYAAHPTVLRKDGGSPGPDFCLHAHKCAGRSSCPRNYSCVE